MSATPWTSLSKGADFLGVTPGSLRRTLERNVEVAPDGGTEANIDGLRARKFGRLWRIQFSDAWLARQSSATTEGASGVGQKRRHSRDGGSGQ
jgi:hypothetical protein